MDLVNKVSEHPLPGETIHGKGVQYFSGGKGANQAVAAAKAGGITKMIGAVGNDAFGKELMESLEENGVNTDDVLNKEVSSGLAFITVNAKGENTIILSKGANGELSTSDIEKNLHIIEENDILLLQNEIPWETNQYLIKEATKRNVQVLFNPAPAFKVPEEILAYIDVLIINETETETITGIHINNELDVKKAAENLVEFGVKAVIITLGKKGSYYYDNKGKSVFTNSYKVNAVDTTAAGDTFIGALSVAISKDKPIEEALKFATAASAIAVTRQGAQTSSPTKEEIEAFM